MASKGQKRNQLFVGSIAVIGLAVFGALALLTQSPLYLNWLIGWTVATFIAYGVDKAQARRGGWRMPETWLHILVMIGGFPGGWLGMFTFRHKTRKLLFKVILFAATLVHAVLAAVYLGPAA